MLCSSASWGRLRLTLAALAAAIIWCLSLLGARWWMTDRLHYAFLVWNLFLAMIPLGLSLWLSGTEQRLVGVTILVAWLLFFPNAPYVVTDFIHLYPSGQVPLWFDVLLLSSFAMVALWLGLISLHLVHAWVERHFSVRLGWMATVLACPLAGFGVYLGRFGRWNSWDVWQRPLSLLSDVVRQLTTPQTAIRAGAVTLGFAGLILVTYLIWWAHGRPGPSPRNPATSS